MWTVGRDIAAPAETVWHLLTDLDAWPQWGPTVARAELEDSRPLRLGARGRIWTPVGVPLPFEITDFDPGRAWAWKVAGVEATRHVVTERGNGCRLSFGVPWWAPGYLAVFVLALGRIERMVIER
ncbi:MAG: SRPBCC family protein [Mycobacterium sp.]